MPDYPPKLQFAPNTEKTVILSYNEPKEATGKYGKYWMWGVKDEGVEKMWFISSEEVLGQVLALNAKKGDSLQVTTTQPEGQKYPSYQFTVNGQPFESTPKTPQKPASAPQQQKLTYNPTEQKEVDWDAKERQIHADSIIKALLGAGYSILTKEDKEKFEKTFTYAMGKIIRMKVATDKEILAEYAKIQDPSEDLLQDAFDAGVGEEGK